MKAEILKYVALDFRTFEIDEWCSMLISMNEKCRELQLYSIEWAFDLPQKVIDQTKDDPGPKRK